MSKAAVIRIELPEAERGLNDAQIKRADKLLRRIGDKALPKHKREAARDELSAAEEGRRLSSEQGALDVHFAMLERLEKGRDPTAAPTRDKLGRMRVLSRDGLECLLIAELLTPIQFAAGMRYRALYEATERSLRSAMNGDISGREDTRRLEDVGVKIQARKRLEAKVIEASRDGRGRVNGRALTALRLIAGQGRTLYALAPKSNANQQLYKAAFLVALDLCADHWGMQ